MSRYRIPKHLDAPKRLLIFTLDEVSALLVPTLLGFILFDQLVLSSLMGSAICVGMRYFKQGEGPEIWRYIVYWYFPPVQRYHYTPPSHLRQYII